MLVINIARILILLLLGFVSGNNAENLMDGTEIDKEDRHVPVSYDLGYLTEEATHRAMQSEPVFFYGRVWYDDNANGKMDDEEEGASDLEVSLFRNTKNGDKKSVEHTKTNTNGEWEISIHSIKENREYYLRFVPGKSPHCDAEPFVQGDDSAVNNVKRGTSKPRLVEHGGWYEVNAGLRRYCESPSFPSLDDVYLLIGQSNMAGRAPIDPELDTDPIPDTWLLRNTTDDWVPAKNPLNIYSTYHRKDRRQGIGPGYTFSLQMQEVLPGQVGLVVQAVGGTRIREWKRGERLYENAVQKAKLAMEYGPLRAVLWHQGESDRRHLDGYLDNLETLIADLREDLGISDLPFIAGQLLSVTDKYSDYNDMIVDLPNLVAHTAVVLTDSWMGTDDGSHFDRDGQLELGRRYADAMVPFLQLG